jgi:two-component system nitrate/nitrite response regulator NarL
MAYRAKTKGENTDDQRRLNFWNNMTDKDLLPGFSGRSRMTDLSTKATVGVCETQPVTVEGVKAVLAACPDLEFVQGVHSLQAGVEMVRNRRPAVVLVDKAIGIHGLVQWLLELRSTGAATAVVVWGVSITEAEALRLIQAGARGVLRKAADCSSLLSCLHAVLAGRTWMEDSIFRESPNVARNSHSGLTPREQQVLELVEQGMKNTEIARELGIRPGTVKIHLKHIFEKTGVRGRYGLALTGLKEKGLLTLPV